MRIANSVRADALLTAVAVVPREDEDDRQADQERERGELLDLLRPVERVADVLEALQEAPGTGDVGDPPLHHLAAAQPGPDALGLTLCRRVGHLDASVSSSGASFGRAARRARCCAMSRSMSAKTALNSGSLRIEARLGSKSR